MRKVLKRRCLGKSGRAGGKLKAFSVASLGESSVGGVEADSCFEVGVAFSDPVGMDVLCGFTEQHPSLQACVCMPTTPCVAWWSIVAQQPAISSCCPARSMKQSP